MNHAQKAAELQAWRALCEQATHIRPRQWCGVWQLHAYNRTLRIPYLGSTEDSAEAYAVAREAGISLEEPLS